MRELDKYFEEQAKHLVQKTKRMKSRSEQKRVFHTAIFSMYGLQLAIPVVIGIFGGRILDRNWPSEDFSWTLNCILLGFVIGLYNANVWLYKSMDVVKNITKKIKKKQKKGGRK